MPWIAWPASALAADDAGPAMARSLPSRLALIGHPVSHSLSPVMQGAALRAAGLTLEYEAIDVLADDVVSTMRSLTRTGAAGNVTVPHKEAVAACCCRLTGEAARVGAVNTFWVEGDDLVGDNTDVAGFDAAVRQLHGMANAMPAAPVVGVIGAGGAARAVVAAVSSWPGARARVWNRSPERVASILRRFPDVAVGVSSVAALLEGVTLVVNATSVGMNDDALPIDPDLVPAGVDAMDLVYKPGETAWVRAMRRRGNRATDGLTMLVEQGAAAFARWFGVPPDKRAMWRALGG